MKSSLLAVLFILGFSGAALAADAVAPVAAKAEMPQHPHHGGGPMKDMDKDGDGSVSKAEWDAFFDSKDANKDGKLSDDEMRPPRPQMGQGGPGGMEGGPPRNAGGPGGPGMMGGPNGEVPRMQ